MRNVFLVYCLEEDGNAPGNRERMAIPAAPAVQPVSRPLAKQAVLPSRHNRE